MKELEADLEVDQREEHAAQEESEKEPTVEIEGIKGVGVRQTCAPAGGAVRSEVVVLRLLAASLLEKPRGWSVP